MLLFATSSAVAQTPAHGVAVIVLGPGASHDLGLVAQSSVLAHGLEVRDMSRDAGVAHAILGNLTAPPTSAQQHALQVAIGADRMVLVFAGATPAAGGSGPIELVTRSGDRVVADARIPASSDPPGMSLARGLGQLPWDGLRGSASGHAPANGGGSPGASSTAGPPTTSPNGSALASSTTANGSVAPPGGETPDSPPPSGTAHQGGAATGAPPATAPPGSRPPATSYVPRQLGQAGARPQWDGGKKPATTGFIISGSFLAAGVILSLVGLSIQDPPDETSVGKTVSLALGLILISSGGIALVSCLTSGGLPGDPKGAGVVYGATVGLRGKF